MATYNANISVKVGGLSQLKNLEDRVSELQKRFTKVNAAAANITAPFQGHIKALKEVNTLLKANNDLLNRQYQMAASMARGRGGGSGRTGSSRDAALQKEISEQLARQVDLLKDRARAVAPAGDAMQKLLRAQSELNSGTEANIKMVRQWIRSARDLVNEEERRAKVVQNAAAEELRTKQYIWQQQAKALRDQEAAEIKLSALRVREAEKAARAASRSGGGGGGGGGGVGKGISGALSRVDRAFGGGGSNLINSVIDGGIRGAAVGTFLAGSQFVNAAQNIWGVGDALKSLSAPLTDAIRMLAEFTGQWGIAAVAAAAFAPLLPTIGQAAVQGLQGVGSLGKAIADVTGLTERAQPAIAGLKKSWDSLVSSGPVPALFGLGANSMALTGGQAPQLMNGAAKFQSSMGLEMVKQIADGIYQQIQASADAMEANRRKAQSWADALKQGKEWIEDAVAATRSLEQSRSIAARERLAAAAANNPRVTASRRPGAYQYDRELFPGGNTMTAQPQYRNRLNSQARLTDETRYSWVQALREGNKILRENAALEAKEAAEAERAVAAKREAVLVASRELDFEFRLGRQLEKNAATAQKAEATRQRNYGIRTGIGAGLSLANIPGQAIAQATSIGAAVGGKAGGIAGFVTGSTVALGQFLATATQTGIAAETLQQRLKLLSDGFDSYGKVAETTAALAEKFGMSQNEAAQAFGNAYARLRPMGASLDEIKTIFEGFNTAVKLSGSSTAEAQGAYVQLVQALGAGALRGQELNSILEQAPLLALAIAKEMNTTVGSLKKFGEEGAISSAIVLKALARVRDEGAGRLAKALDTPQQKVKDFQTAWERFQVALTRYIIPAVTKALGGLAALINNISNAIDTLTAKGMAGDLARRTSYGNQKGQIGNRSGQLDDYSAILGELQRAPQRNRAGAAVQLGVAKDISNRLRGIGATGNPEVDKRLQSLQGAAMDLIEGLEKRIQEIDKAAAKPGNLSSLPVPASAAGAGGKEKTFEPSSKAKALMAAAKKLGVSPLDLATIISFETGGTFSPSIRGGAGGNYQGLIQFGPTERRQYGVTPGQSFEEQVVGPVVRYFEDRFKGVGMSTQGADLLTLYRTVLGGNPTANINAKDAFGTSPASGVSAMGPHRQKALSTFFGGDLANIGYDAADAAANLAEGWDEIKKRIQESFAEGQKLSQEFTRQIQLRNAASELERRILQIQFDYADREAQIKDLMDEGQKTELEALNTKIKELEILKAQLDVIYERAGLEREITDEIGKRAFGSNTSGNFRTDVELDPSKTKTKTQEYMDQLQSELADTQAQIVSLAQTIEGELGSAMSSAITDVISGTGTVQQAFSQMFANIGQAFINMATQMLAKQAVLSILQMIGGGLTGGMFSGAGPYQFPGGGGYARGFTMPSFLASGGPMAAGRPYIVGEEGPELILPSQGGYVLNADETQQALADARGAFADNRSALNSITSTSREQQTERLLTSGASSTEIKYSRVGSGDLPFVTEADMLQAARLAAQEGARMGQQRTMAALKNNPGARRTVGL